MEETPNFIKVPDRRTGLFGVKLEGEKGWWMEPAFEEIGGHYRCGDAEWFKRNGKFGYLDIQNRREIIPAEYCFPLYFSKEGYAVTWKDYREGVINLKGETVIPFVYDEIHTRREPIKGEKGESIFRGFACFSDDGASYIVDENFKPDQMREWELPDNSCREYWANPANKELTVAELEEKIKEKYRRLTEMGYNTSWYYFFSREHAEKIDKLEDEIKGDIRDRQEKMNMGWRHNRENAARIGRMNDLLMKAVDKAIQLGKRTAKSLQWMGNVPNSQNYEVNVYVYPFWRDDSSSVGYVPKFKNRSKERERLENQEYEECEMHIRNIIAKMGELPREDCDWYCACFHAWGHHPYRPGDWDFRSLVMDDGQTWDERIHHPAYQDVYFLGPFHHLFCDLFSYSMEDLASINDFRVKVTVELETREQTKNRQRDESQPA